MADEVCYKPTPPQGGKEEEARVSTSVWGDFEIHHDQILGRGGMGVVVRARQISLDRPVAVKILDTTRAETEDVAQGFLERFQLEAKALARVRDSRIISIIQAGRNEDRFWFAMELVDGPTVEKKLSEGAFPEREAVRIAAEVARALDAAFRAGIIHRDVKPANVFLGADGSVKLGDWGLAKAADFQPTKLTSLNTVACTPAYVSPEAAQGRGVDHRSDIYALGCVMYEMVCERPPFESDSNMELLFKHCQEPPLSPKILNPDISAEFDAVILRCLAKEPEARYQTYAELIEDLDAVRAAEPPVHTTPPAPISTRVAPPPSSSKHWIWFFPLAALVAVGFWALRIHRSSPPASPELSKIVLRPAPKPGLPPEKKDPPPKKEEEPRSRIENESEELKNPTVMPGNSRRPAPPGGSFEEYLETYRISPEELQVIRAMRSVVESHDPEIGDHRYEGVLRDLFACANDPRQTDYTGLLLRANLQRLRRASEMWSAFLARLKPDKNVELVLNSKRLVTGAVIATTSEEIELRSSDSSKVRVALKDLAEETFIPGESEVDSLDWRATHGAPKAALDLLMTHHASIFLPRLEGWIHAIILRAIASLDTQDLVEAKGVLDRLSALKGDLPSSWDYVFETRKMLEDETSAAEALIKKNYPALFGKHGHSRAAARGARELLGAFRESLLKEDLVGEDELRSWEPRLAAKLDRNPFAYRLSSRSREERNSISKEFEGARKGYEIRWRLEDGSTLAVALSQSRWLEITRETLKLYRLEERETKCAANQKLTSPKSDGIVSVVPVTDLTLVFLDGRLALALPSAEYALDGAIKFGASGTIILESIRVVDRD